MNENNLRPVRTGPISILADIRDNADTIAFHFSSRNKAAGKFHRYPTPENISNVYINPADLNWYLDGLPELKSLNHTVMALKDLVAESGATNSICIGSSMGAWGAAYMAPMLNAKKAVLFGPELRLNGFGSFSAQNIAHRASDIPIIHASRDCEYVVVAGMQSPCDVYGTAAFFGNMEMSTCYFLPWLGHGTAHGLNQIGALQGVLDGVINNHTTQPLLDILRYQDNTAISEFFEGRDYNFETISAYVDRFVQLKQPTKLLTGVAQDLIGKKLFPYAFNLLWPWYEEGGMPSDMKMMLLNASRKAKRWAPAIRIADELIKDPIHRKAALWQKALVLERLNRIPEANIEMSKLYNEHLQDPVFKIAAEKLKLAGQPGQ